MQFLEPRGTLDSKTDKYEKLPNIVMHACKNITEKMNFLKMCGPQIRLFYLSFETLRRNRQIACRQSLLAVDSVAESRGRNVLHQSGGATYCISM